MDYIAIDFETATYKQFILSYGILKVHNSEIVDSLYSLVYPPDGWIDPFLSSIHGITIDMVTDKGEFPEHWSKINDFIGDLPIVAHNAASADRNFLVKTLNYYGLELPDNLWGCSRKMAEKLYQLGNYKLSNIARHLGIAFSHHNALEDARVVVYIVNDAFNKLGEVEFMKFLRTKESFIPKGGRRRFSEDEDYIHFNLASIASENQLEGKSIAVTGTLRSMTRGEVECLIESLGGRADNGVLKDTQILVVGFDKMADFKEGKYTNKLKKALLRAENDPSFEIIDEEAFMRMIGAEENELRDSV